MKNLKIKKLKNWGIGVLQLLSGGKGTTICQVAVQQCLTCAENFDI